MVASATDTRQCAAIRFPGGSSVTLDMIASDDRDPQYACWMDMFGTVFFVRKKDEAPTADQMPYVCRTVKIPLGSRNAKIANFGVDYLAYTGGNFVYILVYRGGQWHEENAQYVGTAEQIEWRSGPSDPWLYIEPTHLPPMVIWSERRKSYLGRLIGGLRRWRQRFLD